MAGMGKIILWVADKEGRNWIGECTFGDLDEPRTVGSGFTTSLPPEEEEFLITMARQQINFWMPQDIAFSAVTCKPHVIHESLWVWLEVVEGKAMSYRFIFNPPLPIYQEGDNETAPVQAS